MIRRAAGLLTGILVLTFSVSGQKKVCDSMSHQSPDSVALSETSGHEHDSGPGHSHHSPTESAPVDHCQSASSCPGVSLATVVADDSPDDVGSNGVLLTHESAPSSESPDLEPPPPKA